ncbi:MAG: pilus assembly FimT family protein [Pseudomonadota bacterium]
MATRSNAFFPSPQPRPRQRRWVGLLERAVAARQMSFRPPISSCRGFTMIELVLVMVLIGILSIFIIPRFNDQPFAAYGFQQEAIAAARYAQKLAVSGNTPVTIDFTAVGFALSRGGTPVTNPATGQAFVGIAPTGVIVAPALSVTFDGLGRPSASGVLSIGTRSLTIEAETGYVHD